MSLEAKKTLDSERDNRPAGQKLRGRGGKKSDRQERIVSYGNGGGHSEHPQGELSCGAPFRKFGVAYPHRQRAVQPSHKRGSFQRVDRKTDKARRTQFQGACQACFFGGRLEQIPEYGVFLQC